MRHELPPRPHLQHLRKQAKELLDAYREGDRDAQQRFLENLPALSGLGQAELAQTKLALHDAQSVIAREYGFDGWRQLRRELERRDAWRIAEAMIAQHIKRPLPPDVLAALHASWSGRRDTQTLADPPLPGSLPVLAVRDFFLTPGSIAPLHVMRPVSLAALDAAAATSPVMLATFSQREAAIEAVERENLYPVGCQILVRGRFDQAQGTIIIVEGVRWITLQQLSPPAVTCERA